MLPDGLSKRLRALGDVAREGKRVNGLFRLMGHPALWHAAYGKIASNKGALTPGGGPSTLDGFSEDRVINLIALLKAGRFHFDPVRRTYIPKATGKLRPLGMPSGESKLVQEVMRHLLEQIYEPRFSDASHGFRAGRSCHTALAQIQRVWKGVKGYVEMDLKGFFDTMNHAVLLRLLEQRIDDPRFIALVKDLLEAGYLEQWTYHSTYSGTPQGGIVSPILSNIYLHELDTFMERLMAEMHQGKKRRAIHRDLKYRQDNLYGKMHRLQHLKGADQDADWLRRTARNLNQARKRLPAKNAWEAGYKRVRYCRYADDFLIGIIGSKADAQKVYQRVEAFVTTTLHLTVATDKTRLCQAADGVIFLGYGVSNVTTARQIRPTRSGWRTTMRSMGGTVRLRVPEAKLAAFCAARQYGNYATRHTRHKPEWLHRSDVEIVMAYNAQFRGLAQYYSLANNAKGELNKLAWLWRTSLFKTLAAKHRSSVVKIARLLKRGTVYGVPYTVNGKERVLRVYALKDLKKPQGDTLDQRVGTPAFMRSRTEVEQRLNANRCEYCGTTQGYFEVHHVRKLKGLAQKEEWQRVMSAMRRKTLVLCVPCHDKLHAGTLTKAWRTTRKNKVESPVHRKVHAGFGGGLTDELT